ncbi:peptidylprolyl isomerase [Candidatus Auribacterota bacterium]
MIKRYICIAAVLLGLFCPVQNACAEVIDQIVAIVNDDIVTFNELKKVLSPIYMQYEKTYESDELVEKMIRARKEVLKQLISNKLLVQAARKKGIIVNSGEIKGRIASIKERFPSEEAFETALQMDRMNVDTLEESIEEQLLVRNLIQSELAHKAIISPQDVDRYYKEHVGQFREGEMINTCNILIKHKKSAEDGSDKAWELINNIKKELGTGNDFEVLAKRYSEGPNAEKGGDMGFFAGGSMMKQIEDVAFSMKVGETSEIVKTGLGYHILYLKARRSPRQVPFREVSKDIERMLFQQKIEDLKAEYVEKLKTKAYIKIME